jgi:hypothetical protein
MEREPLHDEVLETLRRSQAEGRITDEEYRTYRAAYLHTLAGVAIINSADPPENGSECGVDAKASQN